MKKLFLALMLFSSFGLANVTTDQEYILNHSGSAAEKVQLGTLVNRTKNLLVARYSYAVQGGSTVAAINLLTNLGDKKSYAKLPDNAIIVNAWINTLTAPVSTASSTLELTASSAGDLKAATGKALFIADNYLQGVPTGATTTFIKLSADKIIKLRIAPLTAGTAPLTAGKFDVFIEYVLGN